MTADTRGTDFLTPMPQLPDYVLQDEYLPAEHTTDLTVWRSREILLGSPLGAREVRRLVERMPHVYRLLPYQGQLIDKPVLRLILSTRLPELVWRRFGHVWPDSPHQQYILTHPRALADLLGAPDSQLVGMGVVDPERLRRVLTEPALLRANYRTLICAAMTELFLRSHARRTPLRRRGKRHVPVAAG